MPQRGPFTRQGRWGGRSIGPWWEADGMVLRTVQFLAAVFTALSLVPAGAHFFELFNKIGLDQAHYFTVQGIYRGWALFGIALFGALFLDAMLVVMLRGQGTAFGLALGALAGMAATLAVFFTWIYPTNVATQNWTVAPDNWQALRTQWEYGHAANALITFGSFCLLILSLLMTPRQVG
jgi:hypothetical protein